MSNPDPTRDYSDYEWGDGKVPCPYCKAPEQEGEDLGDHPSFLSYECSECGKQFSYETYQEKYYDEKGNTIKENNIYAQGLSEKCKSCDGKGSYAVPNGPDDFDMEECPKCEGTGSK